MLFSKKISLTRRPAVTSGLRPIDPSQFRHVAGGVGAATDAPKNGWPSPVGTDDLTPPSAPKNGW